jgi:hypothetical protein
MLPLTVASLYLGRYGKLGFDHGAGHPLLFLDDAKEHNYRNNNVLKDLSNYSEWPKVAGAVINAAESILSARPPVTTRTRRSIFPK